MQERSTIKLLAKTEQLCFFARELQIKQRSCFICNLAYAGIKVFIIQGCVMHDTLFKLAQKGETVGLNNMF